jgi:hypothetical protein
MELEQLPETILDRLDIYYHNLFYKKGTSVHDLDVMKRVAAVEGWYVITIEDIFWFTKVLPDKNCIRVTVRWKNGGMHFKAERNPSKSISPDDKYIEDPALVKESHRSDDRFATLDFNEKE